MTPEEHQSAVVTALIASIQRPDWTHVYVHAEFDRAPDALATQLAEGFLVVRTTGRHEKAPFVVETPVGEALLAMCDACAAAGQAFHRLDLVLDAHREYRFDLDPTPSLLLAGQPDPSARGRLDRRFGELLRERGLTGTADRPQRR